MARRLGWFTWFFALLIGDLCTECGDGILEEVGQSALYSRERCPSCGHARNVRRRHV